MIFRVITWNIRKGKGIRGSRPVFEEIVAGVAGLEPDLLLCQEVFHRHGGLQQGSAVAEHLELLHRYEANASYRTGHHGNATFSVNDISAHQNRDISPNRVERRGILYTRIDAGTRGALHAFNTHFALSQRQRLRQARRLQEMIEELTDPGDAVVLAGDFNDWTGRVDPVIQEGCGLENLMLRLDRQDRRTWSTRRPLWSLDRIYVRNVESLGVRVAREPPFHRLSDHYPVVADLRLRACP